MKIVSALVGLILGALVGLGSALAAAGITGSSGNLSGNINVKDWVSDWTIGSASANPWTRARVARHGLLALTKAEAVYFTRNSDDDGDRLTDACTYKVVGGALPAQWWSVTLYNGESYLPDNTDNALSYELTDAVAAGDPTAWSFTVSPTPAQGGWVSSRAAGSFDLTLRLYKPDAALIENPTGALGPPGIEKISCGEPG
jgi:hypothetical protein